MSTIQFIQTTPEQFKEDVLKGMNLQFEELKKFLNPPQDQLLTREETRDLLKVDLSTLWGWTKKGKLKAYGIGNRVYYRRNEVEAALTPLNKKEVAE